MGIIDYVERLGINPITLLVIPGLKWSKQGLSSLKALEKNGYHLAGHGWEHKCIAQKTLFHKIHSAFISRNVAEHLSLDAEKIADIIKRNFQWFGELGLAAPNLYVPPAWAMGAISNKILDDLPFRFYETLTGIYNSDIGSYFRLPLVGFEADTWIRVGSLRPLNYLNKLTSKKFHLPIRIAIHPYDMEFRLQEDLKKLFNQRNYRYASYDEIFA